MITLNFFFFFGASFCIAVDAGFSKGSKLSSVVIKECKSRISSLLKETSGESFPFPQRQSKLYGNIFLCTGKSRSVWWEGQARAASVPFLVPQYVKWSIYTYVIRTASAPVLLSSIETLSSQNGMSHQSWIVGEVDFGASFEWFPQLLLNFWNTGLETNRLHSFVIPFEAHSIAPLYFFSQWLILFDSQSFLILWSDKNTHKTLWFISFNANINWG